MAPRRTHANPPTPYAAAMTPKKEESERTDLSGRLVCNGSIKLVRILGEGGFGQVYEGRHIYHRHSIAVKVIARPQHPRLKEHLATELALHEKMSYLPAIPTWIGHVNDLDYCYIMMEYCPLPSLAELMSKSKKPEGRAMGFDFEARRCIMMKVIEAVRACHSKRVYHRDIKPENILVDLKLLDIRLIDFGLAINQEVSKNCRTGTKEYMSPECYAEFNCHKKSTPFSSAANDVWSLGVLLLFIMLGRKLWLAPSIELEEDDRFARYVARPDTYFYSRYGLTREAQSLVSQVLCLNPNARMSLTDFEMTLAGLRCFFRSEEAIWSSSSKSNSITVSELDFAGKSYKEGCMIRSSALNSAKDLIVTPDGLRPVQDLSNSNLSLQPLRRRHRALSGLFGYSSQPVKSVIEESISLPHRIPPRMPERPPQWLDDSSTSTDLELTPPSLLPATASSGLTFPPPSFDDGIFKPVIEFTLRSKNMLKDRPIDDVTPIISAQSTPKKCGPIILDTPTTSVLGLDSHIVQIHGIHLCPSPILGEPHTGLEEAAAELSITKKKKRGRLFSSARLFGLGGTK